MIFPKGENITALDKFKVDRHPMGIVDFMTSSVLRNKPFELSISNSEYLYCFILMLQFQFDVISFHMQVMSVKALAIALKLSFSGDNQFIYVQTWVFTFVAITCIVLQLNYLNKVILRK